MPKCCCTPTSTGTRRSSSTCAARFAFALWDARKERLLLARDRFGEKPLYLAERDGTLYFASEMQGAARRAGRLRKVDLDAVRGLPRLRYVPGPRTLFAGVRKLAPGSYATWQLGTLRESRYWTPPDGEATAPVRASGGDAVAAFIDAPRRGGARCTWRRVRSACCSPAAMTRRRSSR